MCEELDDEDVRRVRRLLDVLLLPEGRELLPPGAVPFLLDLRANLAEETDPGAG